MKESYKRCISWMKLFQENKKDSKCWNRDTKASRLRPEKSIKKGTNSILNYASCLVRSRCILSHLERSLFLSSIKHWKKWEPPSINWEVLKPTTIDYLLRRRRSMGRCYIEKTQKWLSSELYSNMRVNSDLVLCILTRRMISTLMRPR